MPQNCLGVFSWGCWLEMWRDTLLAEVLFLLEALPSLLSPVTTLPPVPTALGQAPVSSWSSLTLAVFATAMPWKQEDSPTWSLARPREEVMMAV